ncbi:porin [Thetidibacter halocola]|uniref:Porin n=1 Tax=Thetidibacter halocola TaxID=2827239 RepID=A0A8J7WEW5_9RHOB|nr:porin [Thetidibacter halocola]MBS0125517.1 porin [Thetidibacter halocola]
MKKILFATTALVATAGIASAEVQIKGWAEIGIFDNGNGDAQFFTDVDVDFNMTGEADNGLKFGAYVDLDEAANAGANNSDDGGVTYFVAYGGARLEMGDTDGALDKVVPEMNLAGASLNDDQTTHGAFLHNDGIAGFSHDGAGGVIGTGLAGEADPGQIARFDYTYSGFTASVSVEQVNNGSDAFIDVNANGIKDAGEDIGDTIWGIGFGYSGDFNGVSVTAGIGYQTLEDVADVMALGATAGFANGFSVGMQFAELDPVGANNTISAWNIGVGYEMNAIAVGLNYGEVDPAGANNTTTGFGLAASYDLGGGLSAQLGYGSTDPAGPNNTTDTWSLGLYMSF